MNSGPITKLRQNITTIMAAVSVAVVAIPAARAAEPDLVSALRDQGAQIVPLGPRGGLAGYLVTPVGGAGYSLYVTNDGHGVAGLLYGPDGVLLTGGNSPPCVAKTVWQAPRRARHRVRQIPRRM